MKLLALVTTAYGASGGIAQHNRDLLGVLSEMDSIERIDVLPRSVKKDPEHPPDKVRQLKAPSRLVYYFVAALRRALAPRPGVIFCGHISLVHLAAALAKLVRAKLVVQLHGTEAWDCPSAFRRRGLERADLVLCVSRNTRARVLSWADIPPERAIVISNTVSEQFTPGDRHAARKRFDIEEKIALLTVGRLDVEERYKGHDAIIRMLPKLREELGDVVYLVAGSGNDVVRLRAMALSSGVTESVRFMGEVPPNDLPDLYRAADLFVMPSTGEGFGIVFLEAMACGTPALGLALAGTKDAFADGELGDALTAETLFDDVVYHLTMDKPDPNELAAKVRTKFGEDVFQQRVGQAFDVLAEGA